MNREALTEYRRRYAGMLDDAGIALTAHERDAIEIAELGLGEFERQGLGLITYENNDRYCAKELVMLPRQTGPEHKHPPITDAGGRVVDPGKRETFRCRRGEVYLYVEGEPTAQPRAAAPAGSEAYYTVRHEVVLRPGEQYTIPPDVWHWFQAGDDGAIVSEFSSTSRDAADRFTDPRIVRVSSFEGDSE